MQKKTYYLDHASSTKPAPHVRVDIENTLQYVWGNPHSLHELGLESKALLLESEEIVKEFLGTTEGKVIFTNSGTDANIRVIRTFNDKGWGFVTTLVEHKSIDQFRCNSIWPMLSKPTQFDLKSLNANVNKYTKLFSMMAVNNELGTTLPVIECASILKERYKDILIHSDCSAAANCLDLQPYTKSLDILTLSGHKLYGPKGVGCIWVKSPDVAKKIENECYYGTPATHDIVGFASALGAFDLDIENDLSNQAMKSFIDVLQHCSGIKVLGESSLHKGHSYTLHVEDIDAISLVLELSDRGVFCSHGSACSSKESTRVLEAYGYPKEIAQSCIRISFGRLCRNEIEVKEAAQIVSETIKELRNVKY